MNSKDKKEDDRQQSATSGVTGSPKKDRDQSAIPERQDDDHSETNGDEITIELDDQNGTENDTANFEDGPNTIEASPSYSSGEHREEALNAVIIEGEEDILADEFFELVPPEKTVDAGQIDALERELRKKSQEAKDNFERLVRFQAEYDNIKKRHYREKQDYKKYCLESLVLELLPSLDNLERALDSVQKSNDLQALISGIEMIHRGLTNCLAKIGLKIIETKDKVFNPVEHEAMMVVDTTEHKNNVIIEEYQKGYYLHDRVIRPAMVTVAKHVAAVENVNEVPEEQIHQAIKEITQKFKLEGEILDMLKEDNDQTGDDNQNNHDDETNNENTLGGQ
ncbi:nucleotide exchange factor GrpE [bacterium]|nr:nucleotide exchange factor GrpE [bacterium]